MFTLIDGEARHAAFSQTFHIPSIEERRAILPGEYVKLGFQEGENTERAWVEVKAIDGDQLTGTVDNDLVLMTTVKDGDKIDFELRHVMGILHHGEE